MVRGLAVEVTGATIEVTGVEVEVTEVQEGPTEEAITEQFVSHLKTAKTLADLRKVHSDISTEVWSNRKERNYSYSGPLRSLETKVQSRINDITESISLTNVYIISDGKHSQAFVSSAQLAEWLAKQGGQSVTVEIVPMAEVSWE